MKPIIDLHCDLLAYLAENPKHTPFDEEACCSLSQLKAGGVKLQTLALFTETKKESTKSFTEQLRQFLQLLANQKEYVALPPNKKQKIILLPAIENASGLLEEEEEFIHLFLRLETLTTGIRPPLYVSLTWNTENRFGGGNETDIGLKRDGELLLEELSKRNIAVDLSHTSDQLAQDILTYVDRQKLTLPIMASHSNFRHIRDVPRNLPDEIAQEIFKREGIVGLNLVRHFIGETPDDLIRHIEHADKLGGKNKLCFGADFFGGIPLTPSLQSLKPFFFPEWKNASHYQDIITFLEKNAGSSLMKKISFENAYAFLKKQLLELKDLA